MRRCFKAGAFNLLCNFFCSFASQDKGKVCQATDFPIFHMNHSFAPQGAGVIV